MNNPIQLEQYCFLSEDDCELWEITDLEAGDLIEFEQMLTLSAKAPSERLKNFIHDLRRLISSLDTSKAS